MAGATAHRDLMGPVIAGDECAADGRHGRPGDRLVAQRSHRRRHGCNRDPDGVAAQQHVGHDRAADRQHLRRSRSSPGRDAVNRGRAADAGSARISRAAADHRRDPLRAGQLRLRPHAAPRRRVARTAAQHRAGRAGWARWALGRRQIDTRASAARILPAGTRSHPDRRARHRRTDAREPARADRHGHAGHLTAASLDPRQYPLRPARGERGRDR